MTRTRVVADNAASARSAESAELTPVQVERSARELIERMRRTGSVPLLAPRQEIALARWMAEARDPAQRDAARNALICANQRLVASVARQYQQTGVPLDDLIQEGMIGLVAAAERFRCEPGVRFSTYAIWWIRRAVLRALGQQGHAIRLPAHVVQQLGAIRRAEERLRERLGRTPTPPELAAALNTTEEKLSPLLALANAPVSLDSPLGEAGDTCLADLIAAPAEGEDDPAAAVTRREEREAMEVALNVLADRERQVLTLRFGLDGEEPRTLEEMSRRLKLSRERVRQIEAFALRKLRRATRVHGAPWAAAAFA